MQASPPARRPAIDGFDLFVLLALTIVAAGPLLYLLWQVAAHDQDWIGIDYGSPQDQLQYISWIRESGAHVLAGDPYDPASTPRPLLHPGIVLSGLLARAGVAPWLAYLLWKPVAVGSLFVAVRAYVRRTLDGPGPRRAALVLALFYAVSTEPLARHLLDRAGALQLGLSSFELWPGTWLWGYFFAAIGVAALAAALLAYERDRADGRARALAPLLGLVCALFQPWQGATLILVVVVAEAVCLRRGGPLRRPIRGALPTLAATAAPLVYYALLGRSVSSWRLADEANQIFDPAWWTVALALAPLALPAALAYRSPPASFQDVALRTWPVAGLGLLLFISATDVGTYAPHALQGLSIPLAILAVIGIRTLGRRPARAAVLAAAAVALVTLPVTALKLREARSKIARNEGPFFLSSGERDAFRYLDRTPGTGDVLAPYELGQMMPALAGRAPFVGHTSWTPDFFRRDFYVDSLYAGRLSSRQAQALVRAARVRFVLVGCRPGAALGTLIAPLVASRREFGCVSVYTLRS
jgi:hypothetical protein